MLLLADADNVPIAGVCNLSENPEMACCPAGSERRTQDTGAVWRWSQTRTESFQYWWVLLVQFAYYLCNGAPRRMRKILMKLTKRQSNLKSRRLGVMEPRKSSNDW